MADVRDFEKEVAYAGGGTPLEIELDGKFKNVQISLIGLDTDDVTIKGRGPQVAGGGSTPAFDTVATEAGKTTVLIQNTLLGALEFSGTGAGSYTIIVQAWD